MAPTPVFSLRRRFSNLSFILSGLLLLGILAVTGCHPRVSDPKDPKYIVAEKDDWTITRGDLDKEIASYMKQNHLAPGQVPPDKEPILETMVLDNMVLHKVVLAKGATMQLKDVDKEADAAFDHIKSRYPSDTEFQAQLKTAGLTPDELKKRIHDQVIISKVLEADAPPSAEPSDQDINAFYLTNRDRYFNIPAKIRASRILILVDAKASPADQATKKKAIDKAHDRVAKGEDFSKVALEVSEDRYSSPKGGDIGFFQRGENEPEFDQVAFSSKVGELSPVFLTPMGYQFLKVTETQPAGVVAISDARPAITQFLKRKLEQQRQQQYMKKQLADSGVTYHFTRTEMPDNPPGDATGSAPSTGAAGTPPAH